MPRLDDLIAERDAIRAKLVAISRDRATLAGAAESLGLDPAAPTAVDSFRNRGAALDSLRRREQELTREIERLGEAALDANQIIAVRNNRGTPIMPARYGAGSGRYSDVISRKLGF